MLPRTRRIVEKTCGSILITCGLVLLGTILWGGMTFLTSVFVGFLALGSIAAGIQIIHTAVIEAAEEKAYIRRELQG